MVGFDSVFSCGLALCGLVVGLRVVGYLLALHANGLVFGDVGVVCILWVCWVWVYSTFGVVGFPGFVWMLADFAILRGFVVIW